MSTPNTNTSASKSVTTFEPPPPGSPMRGSFTSAGYISREEAQREVNINRYIAEDGTERIDITNIPVNPGTIAGGRRTILSDFHTYSKTTEREYGVDIRGLDGTVYSAKVNISVAGQLPGWKPDPTPTEAKGKTPLTFDEWETKAILAAEDTSIKGYWHEYQGDLLELDPDEGLDGLNALKDRFVRQCVDCPNPFDRNETSETVSD